MKRLAVRITRVAAGVAMLCLVGHGAALADEEYRTAPPLWYTATGGGMFPSGKRGVGLGQGPILIGSIEYPFYPGLVSGLDFGTVQSSDPQNTNLLMAGAHCRLNPSPDLRQLYVQGGGGIYYVTYHPDPGIPRYYANRARPGLSFGVGYDFTDATRLTFGVIGSYTGILMARTAGLSFLSIALYASLRPPIW